MDDGLSARLGSARLTASIDHHVETFAAMGTRVELHLFGSGGEPALMAARRAIEAVDDALTIHRPSPTTALNDALAEDGTADIADPVLLAALAEVDALVAATGGLFDPTADAGRRGAWPAVTFDATAMRLDAAGALDFGGFGKGFALDRACAALRRAGVTSAFLSAGESSIAVIGRHPLDAAWPVGVPDPYDSSRFLVELQVEDRAVSISSTVHADAPARSPSVRPASGQTISAPRTAIAVEPTGAMAEAMSTALLVADTGEADRLIAAAPDRRFIFRFAGDDATPLT